MKNIRRYLLFPFVFLFSLALFYAHSNEAVQAQMIVHLLGIHEWNKDKFEPVAQMIRSGGYTNYKHLEDIPLPCKQQLESYFNPSTGHLDHTQWRQLQEIFAVEGEDWAEGCTVLSGLKTWKFSQLYISKDAVILKYYTGGFAAGPVWDFFAIEENQLVKKASIAHLIDDLPFLAFALRFDPDMANWVLEELKETQLLQDSLKAK
ncbi:MAG: hypothetical protein AAFP19_21175 [Bacteroidota bacterium]